MPTVSELMAQRITNAQINVQTWGGILYNVKAYGAKGDGVADDTAAIQAAINAASAAGGGTVFFPMGYYLISSTLTIPGNVSLEGGGKRKPQIFTNFNGTAIRIEGQGVKIAGLLIDPSGIFGGSINTGNAIDIISTSTLTPAWITIDDVETASEGIGLNVDGSAASQLGDIYVRSSAFFRVRSSGNVVAAVNVRYLFFMQCNTFTTGGVSFSSVSFGANTDNCSWVQGVIADFSFGGATFNLVAVNSTSGTFSITGDRFISTGGNISTLTLEATSTNAYINSIIGTYTDNGTNNRNVATHMADNVKHFGDSTTRSSFRAYQSVAQTITSNVPTKITFTTEVYDHLSEYDTVNSRFTATQSGIYLVSSNVWFSGATVGDRNRLQLYVNGALDHYLMDYATGSAGGYHLTGTSQIKLNAGDYVEIYSLVPTTGATINDATTMFAITRIA